MRKRKFWVIANIMVMALCLMTGCKDKATNEEVEKVVVNKDTEKNKTDSDEKKTTKDDIDNNEETDSDGSSNEATSKEDESSSEEQTAPMDNESSDEQTSTGESVTNSQETTAQQSVVVQPEATQQTQAPTTTAQPVVTQPATTKPAPTQPATEATTAPQNYGSIINKNTYDVEKYSRRGFSKNAYSTAENVVNSILSTSMTEVQRVRAIHDWLVKNVNYDYDTANKIGSVTGYESAFTAEGALVNKLAVCEGYSEAFLLLCWTAGIEARLVEGTGNGGGHEWNVVKVDGKWYQIDVTFDDPLVNNTIDTTGGNLSYDYFLITTNDMSKNHVIASCYNDTLPACTSTDYYEYAKQCTLEVKLGGTPYTIISSYAQADSAILSYNNQRIMKFAFVYAEGSLDYSELLNRAVNGTVNNLNVGVSGGLTVSSSVGYSIAIITLTTS